MDTPPGGGSAVKWSHRPVSGRSGARRRVPPLSPACPPGRVAL